MVNMTLHSALCQWYMLAGDWCAFTLSNRKKRWGRQKKTFVSWFLVSAYTYRDIYNNIHINIYIYRYI